MHSLMYKTEILKNNNIMLQEHCFYTDTEYAIYPFLYSKTIKILTIPLYMYRIGIEGQSMSIEGRLKHYKDHIKVNYKLLEKFNEYNNVIRKNTKTYLENFLTILYANFIGSFMMVLPANNVHYKEIKDFEKDICKLNPNIYKKMNDYSKMVKVLRKGKYITYRICYLLKRCKTIKK